MKHIQECKWCGKEYKLCRTCEDLKLNSYKNACCSIECYARYEEKVLIERGIIKKEDAQFEENIKYYSKPIKKTTKKSVKSQ